MNAISQAITNGSTLEILSIKITNATPTSFLMSMESKVGNTGPMGVTMSPMTVDLCGDAGCFGKLNLPEIKTKASGTTISVTDQKIEIVDMDAFIAFNKAIMSDDTLTLHLKNGAPTIKAFMISTTITYAKSVTIRGMSGPKTTMKATTITATGFSNTMVSVNTSPLEIDLGTLRQEIRNSKGETIAVQKGKVYFRCGESEFVMEGTVTGVLPDENGEARIVGVGVEEDNWNNKTIVNLNTPVVLTEEFVALCKAGKPT